MRQRSRKTIGGLILALGVAAIAVPVAQGQHQAISERSQVVQPASSAYSPQSFRALVQRSEALNQNYGLHQANAQNADPWFLNLKANRKYDVSQANTQNADPWFLNLMAQSKYGTQVSATVRHADDRAGIRGPGITKTPQLASSSGNGFDWGDASLGAATALVAAIMLTGAVALSRRNHSSEVAV
jgi:hypothetical protein